ncbi:MAG: 4-hydroxybutyrate CoA-transferase [Anaerolineae bacterium]|nr:4-hydroxybutyrate CoA-transferase [Anaerolineae bacterium]NUQ03569.1 acetyl-CoA hydrolase/transferase family protein [Anaerolineae bacterium]
MPTRATLNKVTAEEAAAVIKSGHRVFLTGNCSTPIRFLEAVVARYEELENVEFVQVLSIGMPEYITPEMSEHIRVNNLFISDNMRRAVNSGTADFTPVFLSEIPRLFIEKHIKLDVAVIHVSPPDEHGYCSYGVEVGVTKSAAESARIVIAQINPRMPRTLGDSFIHIRDIDYAIEVNDDLPQVRPAPASETQTQIASHIAHLIPDGATLQTGIGGIPDAVLRQLDNHQDLGIHTELFSDGVMEMIEKGVITNAAKTIHTGKVVAGFVLGSHTLYDFIHDNPVIELHPTEYVNDPYVIAKNDRMISINSAIEVDLTGQVCADSIGTSFYSGVGGQVDFVRGASRSRGGKSIIALPSTTRNDTISRIVPILKPGAGVTTTRNDVRCIATEYGVADLFGKTIAQRVEALVGIAHPKFREELLAYAREHYHVGRLYAPLAT